MGSSERALVDCVADGGFPDYELGKPYELPDGSTFYEERALRISPDLYRFMQIRGACLIGGLIVATSPPIRDRTAARDAALLNLWACMVGRGPAIPKGGTAAFGALIDELEAGTPPDTPERLSRLRPAYDDCAAQFLGGSLSDYLDRYWPEPD